jgi:hypothetical protein
MCSPDPLRNRAAVHLQGCVGCSVEEASGLLDGRIET